MPVRELRTLSIWLKIGLACLSIGVLLFVIGFATESWMVRSYGVQWGRKTIGLWKQEDCHYGRCVTFKFRSEDTPNFHMATQAMECLGLIGQLIALFLLLLYIFVDQCRRRNILMCLIFLIFAAVTFMVIGFIIFGVKYEEAYLEVGWSMGVAIAGCIFIFVAGVMCAIQICAK